MAKKSMVTLICSQCLSRNYSTPKNKVVNPDRLTLMKYCKKCGQHSLHKETK